MPAPDTTCAEGGWIERLGLGWGGAHLATHRLTRGLFPASAHPGALPSQGVAPTTWLWRVSGCFLLTLPQAQNILPQLQLRIPAFIWKAEVEQAAPSLAVF